METASTAQAAVKATTQLAERSAVRVALVLALTMTGVSCAQSGDATDVTPDEPTGTIADDADDELASESDVPDTDGDAQSGVPDVGPVWQRAIDDADLAGNDEQWMTDVIEAGPGLVAVGTDLELRAAAVWTSDDGHDWARVRHDESIFGGDGRQEAHGVAAGPSGLVAVGTDDAAAAVWTSPDGQDWSRVTHDDGIFGSRVFSDDAEVVGTGMGSIVTVESGFVAVGYDLAGAAVWRSPDGLQWSRIPPDARTFGSDGGQWMLDVTAAGPGLVAVGTYGAQGTLVTWTSDDGESWTRAPSAQDAFAGSGLYLHAVAAREDRLVAVGEDYGRRAAAVWTSSDGLSWTRSTHDEAVFGGHGTQAMGDVVYDGEEFTALGSDSGRRSAAVWASPDGIEWTRVQPDSRALTGGGTEALANAVATFGSKLVAVGEQEEPDAAAVWIRE